MVQCVCIVHYENAPLFSLEDDTQGLTVVCGGLQLSIAGAGGKY